MSNNIPGRYEKRIIFNPINTIEYEPEQWSPSNRTGRKYYKSPQLLSLQYVPASQKIPKLSDKCAHLKQLNLLPMFAKKMHTQQQHYHKPKKRPQTASPATYRNQNVESKESKSDLVHISLSLSLDVKLHEAENAWKPNVLKVNRPVSATNSAENLYKTVRGILNKLTAENFNPLLEQIKDQNIDSIEKLNGVILLVFEKAVDEPNFSEAYAHLCQQITKNFSGGETANFKKTLITKCQTEFERNVAEGILSRLEPLKKQINESTDMERKMELKIQYIEEEQKLRRRSVCTTRFIGELYKKDLLTPKIMNRCIQSLLDSRSEEKLECLCKLLVTVGEKMETKTGNTEKDQKMVDLSVYFDQMQEIINKKINMNISNRIKFMLEDVLELRKNHWKPRRK